MPLKLRTQCQVLIGKYFYFGFYFITIKINNQDIEQFFFSYIIKSCTFNRLCVHDIRFNFSSNMIWFFSQTTLVGTNLIYHSSNAESNARKFLRKKIFFFDCFVFGNNLTTVHQVLRTRIITISSMNFLRKILKKIFFIIASHQSFWLLIILPMHWKVDLLQK